MFTVALRPQRPYGLLGSGKPRTATSTFTQLLSPEEGEKEKESQTVCKAGKKKRRTKKGLEASQQDPKTRPKLWSMEFVTACDAIPM